MVVRRVGQGYQLIVGERRWRAAKLAGLTRIPAVVREATDAQSLELALVENLLREDLNPMEEAEAYQRLLAEFGWTQEELAQRVGRDRSSIANCLRMLKLPAQRGIPEAIMDRVRVIPIGKGMAGLAAERREPVQVCNLQTDESGVAKPSAKMTQMENRIVLARFKDGYGPVGAYFLHLKTYTQNGLGEEYESKWFPELQKMVGKEYLDPAHLDYPQVTLHELIAGARS